LGKDSLQIENLKLLNLEQSLEDIARFINYCKDKKIEGITSNNPWIAVGGSYPGTLAALARIKFPSLIIGALASSAVVKSIVDYTEFDALVSKSLQLSGKQCLKDIQAIFKRMEKALKDPIRAHNLKSFLDPRAAKLNNTEFLWYFADFVVIMVQYGHRSTLCDALKGQPLNLQMQTIKDSINTIEMKPYEYGVYYLRNTTLDPDRNERA